MRLNQLVLRFYLVFLTLVLNACGSNPPAPVIDRMPQTSKPKPPETKPVSANSTTSNPAGTKDWRPDSHTVKKGDTLFGIGLEYGVDYKDIAAANHITPPYQIQIGQKLDLTSFKTKTAIAPEANKEAGTGEGTGEDGGVVISPIKTDPSIVSQESGTPIPPAVTPVLSEPKAVRETYSLAALNRVIPKPTVIATVEPKPSITKPTITKPTDTKPVEAKPTETKPSDVKSAEDESITWTWPTQGKVIAGFNEASNKGIDITGETSQAIKAASAGKVIYSGSDLRGYGKLVIVKHNKTYLSVYAHNSKIVVKEGQNVVTGQKIAEMGNTDSNITKLHFEIRRLGKSVDPARYLSQN